MRERLRTTLIAAVVPVIVVLVGTYPYIDYQLPATKDAHDESYQPIKTLRFFYSKGQYAHKWGPMPNFVYAPVYAVMLGYWRYTGSLSRPDDDYPYGLSRPHEQIGSMIRAGRVIVLAVGVVSILALGYVLVMVTRMPLLAGGAMLAMTASSPMLLHALGSTKPDGLMISFLALSMSCYIWIVTKGLSMKVGVAFSIFAVASISCKELTVPVFVLPYLGLLVDGLIGSAHSAEVKKKYISAYLVTVLSGVGAYFIVNIVYAPSAWFERMELLFFGSLKDPDVWAPPGQTLWNYWSEMLFTVRENLGDVGFVFLIASILASFVKFDRRVLLAWLPLVSFVVLAGSTAGYWGTRFMLPLVVLAVLPIMMVLLVHKDSLSRLARFRVAYVPLVCLFAIAVLFDVVIGVTAAWADLRLNEHYRVENYLDARTNVGSVYPLTISGRNPGSSRLSYLGYDVDDRDLGEIYEQKKRLPDEIYVSRRTLDFIDDFKEKQARARLWKEETNYDYTSFPGLEDLGYYESDVIKPELGNLAIARYHPYIRRRMAGRYDVLVYELIQKDRAAATPEISNQ